MIDPIFDRLLVRAQAQLVAAREAIARGNAPVARVNAGMAAATLDYFEVRITTPLAGEPQSSTSHD